MLFFKCMPWSIVTIIILFSLGDPWQNPNLVKAPRICVVAIHDSSLFTMCPSELRSHLANTGANVREYTSFAGPEGRFKFIGLYPDGRITFLPNNEMFSPPILPGPFVNSAENVLEKAHPDWADLMRLTDGICLSGWMDPETRADIEKKLRNQRRYTLVDSVDEADLVFLVEGIYHTFAVPGTSQRIAFSLADFQTSFGKPMEQAAMAIVVPAGEYRANPADGERLLQKSIWKGGCIWRVASSGPRIRISADPSQLANMFLRNEAWPQDLPPMCAAWANASITRHIPPRSEESDEAKSPNQGRRQSPGQPAITFRAVTTLVNVPVIASDLSGRYITDIRPEEFHLFDNGVEQTIEKVVPESEALHIAFLLDNSFSTTLDHVDIAKATLAFARKLKERDEAMVVSVGNPIRVESAFSNDAMTLRNAIQGVKVSAGGTRLYDGLELILTERFNRMTGRKAILLLTDGLDTGSRLANLASTLARFEESNVLVYVVGYNLKTSRPLDSVLRKGLTEAHARGVQFVRDLASKTGGRLLVASTPESLDESFSTIADELQHQYTLCFYPSSGLTDGMFHTLKVTTTRNEVRIRTRAGYRPARDHNNI
jgi:Ca-activated chloride channel family protein